MNIKQMKKIAMYRAVETLLANATEIRGLAALSAVRPTFAATLDEVETMVMIQERPFGATLAERNKALGELVDASLTLGGIALSFADQRKMESLAIKVRATEGDFRRARLDQRVRMGQQIHDAVLPLVAELADYGVTAEMVQDLQAKIDLAASALPATRETSVQKKEATLRLATAIRDIDTMLENQIDPLVLPLRKTQPRFYERYQFAREVVGRPGARASVAAPADAEVAPLAVPVQPESEKLAA